MAGSDGSLDESICADGDVKENDIYSDSEDDDNIIILCILNIGETKRYTIPSFPRFYCHPERNEISIC